MCELCASFPKVNTPCLVHLQIQAGMILREAVVKLAQFTVPGVAMCGAKRIA